MFTTEDLDSHGGDVGMGFKRLPQTARFAHSDQYVKNTINHHLLYLISLLSEQIVELCGHAPHRFEVVKRERFVLRTDHLTPLMGWAYIVKKL